MKFVIEEAWCSCEKKITGIALFYRLMKKVATEAEIEPIVFDKSFLAKIDNTVLQRLLYFIWLNTVFLFKLLMLNDDVAVIGVKYFIPFIRLPRVKYYPVVHDLIAVKYPHKIPKSSVMVLRPMMRNAVINGDKIITVSETAKKEIAEYYKILLSRIDVMYSTFSFDTKINLNEQEILNKYELENSKFILSVSSLQGHKNIDSLIKGFNNFNKKYDDIKLVIVGSGDNLEDYKKLACKNVVFTGRIDDEILKVLYHNAYIYSFPSYLEGFGVPIIDAQQFGVPILCSNLDVFKEVAGENGAIFVNPTPENLEKGLEELLNQELRERLIQFGYENIKRFNMDAKVRKLKEILYGE